MKADEILKELRNEFDALVVGRTVRVALEENVEVDLTMEWQEAQNCDYTMKFVENDKLPLVTMFALKSFIESDYPFIGGYDLMKDIYPEANKVVKEYDQEIDDFCNKVNKMNDVYNCEFWDAIMK
jgi:hypothetical protein